MKAALGSTAAASLIATATGLAVWLFGLAKVFWPAHPQIAAFAVTVVTGIVVKQAWPARTGQEES
jgi:hypothetical protein